MTDGQQQCPKCNGRMEQGFILDKGLNAQYISRWAAGQPENSFFTVTKVSESQAIPIGAFRCSSCGYLESYARYEFSPR
jgi:predicted nucleic-acid-binding Zn-ribbon protein